MQEGTLLNSRGQRLYLVSWSPPSPKCVVAQLFWNHGLGEHIRRYDSGGFF